ncbi:MAG: hypothetical protein V9E93_20115 [Steroidobacteraceae bacterium]
MYTHSLLEPSMTFILSHAQALRRYQPVYAGAHRVQGAAAAGGSRRHGQSRWPDRVALEEFLFRQFGMAAALRA